MAWIERTDRREKKAKHYQDSDNPRRFRAEFTIHDRHYNNGGHWDEVDEDIADDGAGGFDKACDKTRHKIRFAGNGRRRWYPRRDVDEYVEITGIEYWTDQGGGRWRNLTLPASVWKKQGVIWEQNDLRIEVINTWKQVKETFTLLNNDAPTRLRFGLELSGLAYDHTTGKLTSTTDGLVWGSIDPPTAQDENEAVVPVTATYDGTWIEWSVNTSGATYPITVDPTFTDGNGGDVTTAKDTFLGAFSTENNNGVAQFLNNRSGPYVALIEFDLSSIAAGSTCDSATLYLYKIGSDADTTSRTMTFYSVASGNAAWIEGTKSEATAGAGEPCWEALAADGSGGVTTAWAGSAGCATSGTDYEASSIGSYTFTQNEGAGTEHTASLNTTRVAGWFGASNTNYGIRFVSDAVQTTPSGVASAENPTTGRRPKLVVEYTEAASEDELTATGITFGTPALDEPTIGQVHALAAGELVAGAPDVALATLGQVHVLGATGITFGTPSLGLPSIGVAAYALTATGISTGTPTLGTPTLNWDTSIIPLVALTLQNRAFGFTLTDRSFGLTLEDR